MAFVREKVTRNASGTYRYYSLVENYREDNKVRQRVVRYLGRCESLEDARIAAGIKPAYLNRLDDLDHNRRVGLRWERDAELALRALRDEGKARLKERIEPLDRECLEEYERLSRSDNMTEDVLDACIYRYSAKREREMQKFAHSYYQEYDELKREHAHGHNAAWFALDKAMELYDELTPEEQTRARKVPIVAEGLAEREIGSRRSTL